MAENNDFCPEAEISLIICTRNRAEDLSTCLSSLLLINAGKEIIGEIIIIDNHSDDHTKKVVNSYTDKIDHLVYYFEPKLGLSSARNLGINKANYNWLVFMDDDAKFTSDYFLELCTTIKTDAFDAFTGKYIAWYKYPKPHWLPNEFGSKKVYAKEMGPIQERDYFSGGIMAIKSKVLKKEKLYFPIHLGMKGEKIGYGEESYLIKKLQEKGYRLGINPLWIIQHKVRKEKYKIKWHLNATFAMGRDRSITEKKSLKQVSFLFWNYLKTCIYQFTISSKKLLTRKNYYWQNFVLDNLKVHYSFWGKITGLMMYTTSK